MSAAPLPRPEVVSGDPVEPARNDADGWALLDGLRRKLDDQAAQSRRTHDQVQQLTESIGALVAAQRKRSRWLNLNSFGAYLLFTLLCGTAAVAMYASRADELIDARDRAIVDRDAAVHRADAADARLAARDAAAARAAIDARAAEDPVAKRELRVEAAITAFKAQRYGEARAPLEAALAADPAGVRAPSLHYYLGVIALGDGRLDEAIAQLDAAITGGVGEDDARYQLAVALDRNGELAKARVEYDKFATAHPQMQLATFAMRRSATIARTVPAAPARP